MKMNKYYITHRADGSLALEKPKVVETNDPRPRVMLGFPDANLRIGAIIAPSDLIAVMIFEDLHKHMSQLN